MSGNGIFAMSPQKWEFSGLNCVDALRRGASQLRSYEPHFIGIYTHEIEIK